MKDLELLDASRISCPEFNLTAPMCRHEFGGVHPDDMRCSTRRGGGGGGLSFPLMSSSRYHGSEHALGVMVEPAEKDEEYRMAKWGAEEYENAGDGVL
jgi:hypothetical protein